MSARRSASIGRGARHFVAGTRSLSCCTHLGIPPQWMAVLSATLMVTYWWTRFG